MEATRFFFNEKKRFVQRVNYLFFCFWSDTKFRAQYWIAFHLKYKTFSKSKKTFLQSLRSDRVTTEIASRGSLVGIWCGHWGIALLCKITSSLCAQIFNACTSGLKRFILVSFFGFNYSKILFYIVMAAVTIILCHMMHQYTGSPSKNKANFKAFP